MTSSDDKRIDMTMRLWSDEVPLGPVIGVLGVLTAHIHVAGEPVAMEGRFVGRLADRHYATTTGVRGQNREDVAAWLGEMLHIVGSQPQLVDHLQSGRIEGLLWIALLYCEGVIMPSVDPQMVDAVARLGLKILLEDYTVYDDIGAPKTTWLPHS